MKMLVIVLMAMGATGCALTPSAPAVGGIQQAPIRIVRGRPNRVIDKTGWVVGIPNKVALWDRRADNHEISPETEEQLVQYMVENNLDDVLVRVNQYDPLGEWRRMVRNKQIGAGWKYTVGTLNMLEYTLLPGRILGNDWYNPFTDTINIYSDIPVLSLTEAAYAKDVRQRRFPGGYAAVNELPVVGMWHETIATRDVLNYMHTHGDKEEQQETQQILYPDYGAAWGGQVASFIPYGHLFGRLAGAAVGHTVNGVRTLVSPRKKPPPSEEFSEFPENADTNKIPQDSITAIRRLPAVEKTAPVQAANSNLPAHY